MKKVVSRNAGNLRCLSAVLALLWAFIWAGTSVGQSLDTSSVANIRLMKLEEDLLRAFVAGDSKGVDNMLAADYQEMSYDGRKSSKQDIVANVQPITGIQLKLMNVRSRQYGGAAVVTGVLQARFSNQQGIESYFGFTDTFISNGGAWKLVASQTTAIPVWLVRKLEDDELKPLIPMPCEHQGELKAVKGDIASFLRIRNNSPADVVTYWLNYKGEKAQKRIVEAGRAVDIYTFDTHPFLVTDTAGNCIGVYVAGTEPEIAVIGEKAGN